MIQELVTVLLSLLLPQVKKFVRAYHHIRFNFEQTSYIPKFDAFDTPMKIEFISDFENISEDEIASKWPVDQIEFKFKQIIQKQTKILEKDLIDATS